MKTVQMTEKQLVWLKWRWAMAGSTVMFAIACGVALVMK